MSETEKITLDPSELGEDGWTDGERSIYDEVRSYLREVREDPTTPPERRLGRELMEVLRAVWERNHASSVKRLYRSDFFTRALRHVSRDELFPVDGGEPFLLTERLEFLFGVWQTSRQRPVVDAAALECLELEYAHAWSEDDAWRKRAEVAARTAREPVLPAIALISGFSDEHAREQYELLRAMPTEKKHTRMAELAGVIDATPESQSLELLVTRTLAAIFDGASSYAKGRMVTRLMRELRENGSMKKHDRWRLLLDPLIAHNTGAVSIIIAVLDEGMRQGADVELYARLYLEKIPPEKAREDVVDYLATRGSRHAIRLLYPITEVTGGIFGRPTAASRKAAAAIDAIMEREGLTQDMLGALSVAEAGGGELSLVIANSGALSLSDADLGASGMPVPASSGSSGASGPLVAALIVIVLTIIASVVAFVVF